MFSRNQVVYFLLCTLLWFYPHSSQHCILQVICHLIGILFISFWLENPIPHNIFSLAYLSVFNSWIPPSLCHSEKTALPYNSWKFSFQAAEAPHCISLVYFCHNLWVFDIYVISFHQLENLSSEPKVYWNIALSYIIPYLFI